MIWIHEYKNEQGALEGATQQLFKHIHSTRFITPCPPTPSNLRANNRPLKKNNHPLKKSFFLALPGDKFGTEILNFWQENHYNNPIWQRVAFYQTHEKHFAPYHTPKNYRWDEHLFFKKAGVKPSQIHPIERVGNIEKNASIYALSLPHSQGLYYNPAQAFEGQYTTSMFESPFHCAILFLGKYGEICYTHNHRAPFYGTSYYTVALAAKSNGITISAETLLDTPRLLLIILERNFEHIVGDSALSFLLKNHPNIHIFSDIKHFGTIVKEKGLDSMWFYELRIAP